MMVGIETPSGHSLHMYPGPTDKQTLVLNVISLSGLRCRDVMFVRLIPDKQLIVVNWDVKFDIHIGSNLGPFKISFSTFWF